MHNLAQSVSSTFPLEKKRCKLLLIFSPDVAFATAATAATAALSFRKYLRISRQAKANLELNFHRSKVERNLDSFDPIKFELNQQLVSL